MTKKTKSKVEFLKYVIDNNLFSHFFVDGMVIEGERRNMILLRWFSSLTAKTPRKTDFSEVYKFFKRRLEDLDNTHVLAVTKLINEMKHWDDKPRE